MMSWYRIIGFVLCVILLFSCHKDKNVTAISEKEMDVTAIPENAVVIIEVDSMIPFVFNKQTETYSVRTNCLLKINSQHDKQKLSESLLMHKDELSSIWDRCLIRPGSLYVYRQDQGVLLIFSMTPHLLSVTNAFHDAISQLGEIRDDEIESRDKIIDLPAERPYVRGYRVKKDGFENSIHYFLPAMHECAGKGESPR